MILDNSDKFITLAVNNLAPINGMYMLYTAGAADNIPVISSGGPISTSGGIITSGGATLDALKEHVASQGDIMGLARISEVTPGVISSGANVFYATTANAEYVCGLPFSAGVYARAALLTHNEKYAPQSDTALDYNPLDNAVVLPANGAITLIDKVTAE